MGLLGQGCWLSWLESRMCGINQRVSGSPAGAGLKGEQQQKTGQHRPVFFVYTNSNCSKSIE
jgi:hypothetical protein